MGGEGSYFNDIYLYFYILLAKYGRMAKFIQCMFIAEKCLDSLLEGAKLLVLSLVQSFIYVSYFNIQFSSINNQTQWTDISNYRVASLPN